MIAGAGDLAVMKDAGIERQCDCAVIGGGFAGLKPPCGLARERAGRGAGGPQRLGGHDRVRSGN
jgi:hypothetical protein